MAKQRKTYTDEFKRDAVRMMRTAASARSRRSATTSVTANQVHRCAKELAKELISKRNELGEALEEENRRLRKENEHLLLEKTVLNDPRLKARGSRVRLEAG